MKQRLKRQLRISMKLRAGSLKIKKRVTNLQLDLLRKKWEKALINKIKNKRGKITMDTTEIQRIIREYYEQKYAIEFDNKKWINSQNHTTFQD